ncbi:hypothetical protein N341_02098, partial [Tyto alba]
AKTTVSHQKGLVMVEERGTFQTTWSFQIRNFCSVLCYQQRGGQIPHLFSYHTSAGPKWTRLLTTWLNIMEKYKLQWLQEFEVSDAGLCLCAV